MTPLAVSGMVQLTLIESDERVTAETSLGADGAKERVLESHIESNPSVYRESHVLDHYIHNLNIAVHCMYI